MAKSILANTISQSTYKELQPSSVFSGLIPYKKEGAASVPGPTSNAKRKKVQIHITIEKTSLVYTTSKKKKPEKLSHVPLQLIWLQERNVILLKKEEDAEFKPVNCFELILPNQRLLLCAPSLEQKKNFISGLKSLIVKRLQELKIDPESEHRIGVFAFPNMGTYDGNWLNAQPHGEGTFTDLASNIYQGFWHSVMKAGYGKITRASGEIVSPVGWEYDVPFNGVAKELPEDKASNGLEEMTLQDLEVLLGSKGVQCVEFNKGDVVIQEGSINTFLYRIKSGMVECRRGNTSKPETFMPPMMFGEMAIFEKKVMYATFVATSEVELYKIDIQQLYSTIFSAHPNLAKRFNLQIAKKLAYKLSNMSGDGEVDPTGISDEPTDGKGIGGKDDKDVVTANIGSTSTVIEKLSNSKGSNKGRKPSGEKDSSEIGSEISEKDEVGQSSDEIDGASESESANFPFVDTINSNNTSSINSGHGSLSGSISNRNQLGVPTAIFGRSSTDSGTSEEDEIYSKFTQIEKGVLCDDFWSRDEWFTFLDYCSEDIAYRDPFSGDTACTKEYLKLHKLHIHAHWPIWRWKVEEKIMVPTTGASTSTGTTTIIYRGKVALYRDTISKPFIEPVVVWVLAVNNENNGSESQPHKFLKIDIYFDTAKLPRDKRFTKEKHSALPISQRKTSGPPLTPSSVSSGNMVILKSTVKTRRKSDPKPPSIKSLVAEVDELDPDIDGKPRRKKSDPSDSPRAAKYESISLSKRKKEKIMDNPAMMTSPRNGVPVLPSYYGGIPVMYASGPKKERTEKFDKLDKSEKSDKSDKSDRAIEKSDKMPPKKLPKSPVVDNPEYIQTGDMKKFAEEFQLPEGESISYVQEFNCQLDFGSKLVSLSKTRKTGICYITTKYLCYYKNEAGNIVKDVIPTKFIKQATIKENTNTISIKIDRKGMRAKSTISVPAAQCTLSFNTYIECSEALRIIDQFLDHNSAQDKPNGDSPRKEKSNAMQQSISSSTLDHEIVNCELSPSKNIPSIRLTGPRKDGVPCGIPDEICGYCISSYPRVATISSDGSVVLSKERQGDPICDQFCLERYQNRTLFAVADGCNWGKKPQTAAKIAAQTFVDFNKRTIFDPEMRTTQAMMRSFLNSFLHAHTKILEGHEKKWWECGTTTLLGGCITEINDPQHKWAFICLSVGDCKAYHLSFRENLEIVDITKNSRTGEGALDARDCGGRLGPYKHGDPDLRNLSAFFQYVDEGDIIICCSDGVYDNLDPQSLGVEPQSLGINFAQLGIDPNITWEQLEEAGEEVSKQIELKKIEYSVERLKEIMQQLVAEKGISYKDLTCSDIASKVINYCLDNTQNTRQYMESNPNNLQPRDYKEYPGKVDHSTCLVTRVCRSNFRQQEADMENLVVRLRHPTYGINKEAEGVQQGTFKGQELIRWLHHDPVYGEDEMEVAQSLMNFNFIAPVTAFDSYTLETFDPTKLYQFKSHEPIMTRRDWEIILQGTLRKTYQKGDVIIKEGTPQQQIYQLTYGICRIEKALKRKAVLRKGTEKPGSKKSSSLPQRQNSDPALPSVRGKSGPSNTTTSIATTSSSLSSFPPASHVTHVLQLGTIGAPQTFGEVSMLIDGKSSASVIAHTDEVEVIILDKNFINIMFVRYPDMAGRFYHYLASVLARRLSFHEAANCGFAVTEKNEQM